MTALAASGDVSPETLELVLGSGDLAKLTAHQRVEYMARTCRSLGLNPLTRPFRFLAFQNQVQMYATRDCADQLRATRKINLTVADKTIDGDLFIVTVRARTPEGREDEDVGAVTLGQLRGEARANAIMKAMTKAKRRVTLSICGLGFLDETEVETLSGAQTFEADAPPPAAPPPAPAQKRTIREWLDEFEAECAAATSQEDANHILVRQEVITAGDWLPAAARGRYDRVRKQMVDRLFAEPPPEDAAEDALFNPETVAESA